MKNTRRLKMFSAMMALVITATLGLSHAHAGLSAKRTHSTPGLTYLRAAQRLSIQNGNTSQTREVVWEKGAFDKAKWERVPELSPTDLQTSFELARDEKPFTDEENRLRRATWLYPDDGCFVRAVIAADVVAKTTSVKTAKIFAFDSLSVKTANSPDGVVEWWYHVAAIAKTVDPVTKVETFHVYDPALQPKAPIEVHEWLKMMNAPNADVAVCSGDAYDPNSDCEKGIPSVDSRAQSEAPSYLYSEWSRIEELGRDPKRELGDFPPWL